MKSIPWKYGKSYRQLSFDVLVPSGANVDIVVPSCSAIPLPGREERVGPISIHVGGGGAISAVGLAQLGLKPAVWGIVGNDTLGRFVEEELVESGVAAFLERSGTESTGVSLAFNPETDRSFITWDGSCTDFQMDRIPLELVKASRHVHFTGYRGRSNHRALAAAIATAKRSNCTISLDTGWDDSGEWYEGFFELADAVDVVFCNGPEAQQFTRSHDVEEALGRLLRLSSTCAVKLGAEGSLALREGEIYRCPAFTVKVVDTTGAGDSFNAGFLYGFLYDLELEDCLVLGNACGAISVTKAGGATASPNREELEAFLRERDRLPARWERMAAANGGRA